MDWSQKVAIVTGGSRGIGKAYAEALHAAGAKVAVADLDRDQANAVGEACGGFGARVDVSNEGQVAAFITETEKRLGPVDIYVSNAGIGSSDGPLFGAASAPNTAWEDSWQVNVMGSVYAARHVIPGMVSRGGGSFVIVASAAGLLAQLGCAPYTVTKHAAVAFAESLAVAHGDEGIKVACACPQAVNTRMIEGAKDSLLAVGGVVEPETVAQLTLKSLDEGKFFVFPHEEVADYIQGKAAEPDRWLGGMRKLRRGLVEKNGRPL
ncbi:SDR family NAD(P)-dependent oxidoreductase [Hirschia maritima]|uniref:SDR family NAD(P)-dependent oxidoreductase n=1 Tax=Hirschia maritima TaxID=1121961 RepID=UPI00037F9BA2|nr:SDR family oxidoreductase [Hirschia maritima]